LQLERDLKNVCTGNKVQKKKLWEDFMSSNKWYHIHVFFQPFGCLIVGN